MFETIRMAIAGIITDHKAPLLAKKAEAPTEENKHSEIPLKRAVQLTLVTGDTRLMAAIAEEAGGVFIPGHQLVGGKFSSERAAMKVMKESAELIQDYLKVMEDGKVTAAEYKELIREAMHLQLATACIVESAKEKAGL